MNIHDEIEPFEYVKQEPRFQQQREIEDAIMAFGPDFMESMEIMDSVMASLGRRYEQYISDVDHAYNDLKESLLGADATEQRAFDEYNNRLRQISGTFITPDGIRGVHLDVRDGHAFVQSSQSMQVEAVRLILKGEDHLTMPSRAPYGQRNLHQKF